MDVESQKKVQSMDNSFIRTARLVERPIPSNPSVKTAQRCASGLFEMLVDTELSYSHAPLFEVAAIRKSGNQLMLKRKRFRRSIVAAIGLRRYKCYQLVK